MKWFIVHQVNYVRINRGVIYNEILCFLKNMILNVIFKHLKMRSWGEKMTTPQNDDTGFTLSWRQPNFSSHDLIFKIENNISDHVCQKKSHHNNPNIINMMTLQ